MLCKMVGAFSRAFGGCRANFSRFRGSQARFAFNNARSGSRRKVFPFSVLFAVFPQQLINYAQGLVGGYCAARENPASAVFNQISI